MLPSQRSIPQPAAGCKTGSASGNRTTNTMTSIVHEDRGWDQRKKQRGCLSYDSNENEDYDDGRGKSEEEEEVSETEYFMKLIMPRDFVFNNTLTTNKRRRC